MSISKIAHSPGHLIRRLNQAAVSLFLEEVGRAGYDLTPVQYAALAEIEVAPGIDQATLAAHIAYDRATIGGVVSRLVDKGLVHRGTSSQDRRAKQLHLTAEGKRVRNDIEPLVEKVQQRILAGLSVGEGEVLVKLLYKAAEASNEHSRAPLRIDDE